MRRLLLPMVSMALLFGCDSGKPAPDGAKTSQAEAKVEAKADDTTPDKPESQDEGLTDFDPKVTQAADIAAQISKSPQDADKLLAAAGLDRDGLDKLMYEIANDPELTAQYRMARGI